MRKLQNQTFDQTHSYLFSLYLKYSKEDALKDEVDEGFVLINKFEEMKLDSKIKSLLVID